MTLPARRSDLVVGACVLFVSMALVRLVVDVEMVRHVHSLRPGQPLTDAEVPVLDRLRVTTHWGIWAARITVLAAIVGWMSRARRIVQDYDCDLYRSDPDFAVTGWFLPPMNLGVPYLLMADVWTASHPSRKPEAILDRLPVPKRIGLWWGLFVLNTLLGVMGLLDQARSGNAWAPFDVHLDYGTLTMQIVSAVLLAWIVTSSTRFIEQRAATSSF